jgi:hypothetical protein
MTIFTTTAGNTMRAIIQGRGGTRFRPDRPAEAKLVAEANCVQRCY